MKHPSQIRISDYHYDLPDERIAKYPLAQRDRSKLLVYKSQKLSEDVFINLEKHLPESSLLVFNDTRVISARLNFKNNNGRNIEIFCLEPSDDTGSASQGLQERGSSTWKCLVGNLRRWKQDELVLEKNNLVLKASIRERSQAFVLVTFSWEPATLSFAEVLKQTGNLPIPPYLNRETEVSDEDNYQTAYSKNEGSVAAPTAGLHFTPAVLTSLQNKKIENLKLTLHVGAGTFQPVKSENVGGHQMHAEWIDVSADAIKKLTEHIGPIIPVGTTSLRTIESLYWMGVKILAAPGQELADYEVKQWDPYDIATKASSNEALHALSDWMRNKGMERLICKTSILIAPPYQLRLAKGILTNFHQPQSTLLLLISAITGEKWRDLYTYALENGFRFLSYGDSSLIIP